MGEYINLNKIICIKSDKLTLSFSKSVIKCLCSTQKKFVSRGFFHIVPSVESDTAAHR